MSTTTSSKPLFTRQQLIALLGAVSVFFVALLYLFRPQILTTMFGHIEPDVMAATNTYYSYVMASIPGIALYNGGAALFRSMGNSKISMQISVITTSRIKIRVMVFLWFLSAIAFLSGVDSHAVTRRSW